MTPRRVRWPLRPRLVGPIRGRLARTPLQRPPYGSPAEVEAFAEAPADESFITGNGFAARCRYVLNYDVPTVNEHIENDWWFCKADYLEYLFREVRPQGPFVLISHNSDRSIGEEFLPELRRRSLVRWFAQNPAVSHEKLRALPIGIANPRWDHGDQAALKRVQASAVPKRELFDVSFNVETNPAERQYCLERTGLELAPRRPFAQYLERLASAWFCISPRGNGIDCVRTWEALYLRTIPVVTRSLVTDHHADLPMVVLDDWSDFARIEFSPELHERIWGDWSPDELRLDRYVDQRVAAMRP